MEDLPQRRRQLPIRRKLCAGFSTPTCLANRRSGTATRA
jgi:hypothetical protein